MAYQHANHMAASTNNRLNGGPGRSGAINGTSSNHPDGSVVGYIPDDISSVHSSAIGGAPLQATQFPPVFQGFQEAWPTLPQGNVRNAGAPVAGGTGGPRTTESVAGESVADSQITDLTTTTSGRVGGQGGVSLAGLSIQDLNKQASLSQSDKLRRYVEAQNAPQPPVGTGRKAAAAAAASVGPPGAAHRNGERDEDAQSVSTAFASQVGGGID